MAGGVAIRAESCDLSLREVMFLLDRGIRAVQASENLVVDGIIGPKTRVALDRLMLAQAIPSGKGMFVRSIKHVGSVAAMMSRIETIGLRWLAFQAIWQYKGEKSNIYKGFAPHAKALRASARQSWVWGYPYAGKEDEFIDVMLSAASSCEARGIIVDAEQPYDEQPAAAEALMGALMPKARKAGLCVGFTSYGAPWYFKKFPWKAFAAADFAVPQIYDKDNNQGPKYPKKSIDAYKKLGFQRIIPACPTFSKTPKQLKALHAAMLAEEKAICWWDWYNSVQNPFTWDHLRDFVLPE